MKDYYKILEVNKSASSETIAKVYKVLAKKYHPDANPDNTAEAEAKFKEISEAYEILSDQEKRRNYDLELEAQEQQSSNNNNTVPMDDYISLKNYCEELQNSLNSMNNSIKTVSYSNNIDNTNKSVNDFYAKQEEAKMKAEMNGYKAAVDKAYRDSYIRQLKRMGYKIKYKQTFKQKFKNFLALLITFAIVSIFLYIAWQIPSLKEKIISYFTFKK